MDLLFVQPKTEHRKTVVDFVRAFDEHGQPLIHGTDELSAFDVLHDADAYDDWLSYVYAPKGTNRFGYDKMPSSIYLALYGDGVVGMLNLRHELNEFLGMYGGHIGYTTHPDFEGRGVATSMLAFGVQTLNELGVSDVLVTCSDDNVASAKVIEKCGGVLERIITPDQPFEYGRAMRRYWIRK
ncbi:Predicted acetyltransferase [Moraxella ovis]|uniref:Predicted acetyltransferase n=2 Tax=Moraxella ovis TaxID=29433 RepID=A0A378PPF2_9GAMM|nr:GNAT family N-acetyltransferase [Moraxella ovis]SPX81634.1 Predicted acetyltransferase [Moraxella ovis]STY87990.1 Predicted acetyltransferase [Moraxella ovis]STZ05880.1 Predicted acetyltransferase [Moraxella ovis]